jgi:hypothetical protein
MTKPFNAVYFGNDRRIDRVSDRFRLPELRPAQFGAMARCGACRRGEGAELQAVLISPPAESASDGRWLHLSVSPIPTSYDDSRVSEVINKMNDL